jgi:hypothetical protein
MKDGYLEEVGDSQLPMDDEIDGNIENASAYLERANQTNT